MSDINPEFIERYQILYDRDPKSKVFAPLAEAYRKMGLNNKALILCKEGLKHHPNFAGGHVAMARALLSLEEPKKAAEHLQKAVELSPENILAQSLLGKIYVQLKKPKEALNAYKMALFYNPNDKRAIEAVSKLENLTADDFPEDIFSNNSTKKKSSPPPPLMQKSSLDRSLSLIDAHLVRSDFESAKSVFFEALEEFGDDPLLLKKRALLNLDHIENEDTPHPSSIRNEETSQRKVNKLKLALDNIQNRRKDSIPD